MVIKTQMGEAKQNLGFTGLELLTQSYLNALQIVSGHRGLEIGSLKEAAGIKVQLAQVGIDNVRKYHEVVLANLPTNTYSHLRQLADRMYGELCEVMVTAPEARK